MLKLFSPILILCSVCFLAASTTAGAATVLKVDDATVSGDLLVVREGTLTLGVSSPSSTTKPATQASNTTKSATQASSISMKDIVQVRFREPPAPSPKTPPPATAGTENRSDEIEAQDTNGSNGGVLSSIWGALLGGGGDTPPTPRKAVKRATAAETNKPSGSASRPSPGTHWQMTLATGDVLHGRIDGWSQRKIAFKLEAAGGQSFDVPAEQVAALWCGDEAARAKARALAIPSGPEDIAFVQRGPDVVAVKGLALGINGDSLQFRYDEQDRKISLGKLVGVVVGSGARQAPAQRFHQTLKLDSGDVLSGTWTGLTADAISLQTPWGSVLQIPVKSIYTIDFVDGRLTYLSDMQPAKVEQTPYFGRVIPWRADHSLAGGPLQLSDGQYAKGVAVHSRCVLDYDIQAAFQQFRTKVGFEQPGGKRGWASIRVLGDGKILYENHDAHGEQKPVEINLDVTQTRRLTLEVDFDDHSDVGGRVIWANARLLRANVPE